MAGVKVALVLDFEQFGLEGIEQPFPDYFNSLFVQLINLYRTRRLG